MLLLSGTCVGDICDFWILFAKFLGYLRYSGVICEIAEIFAKFRRYLRFSTIYLQTPKRSTISLTPPLFFKAKNPPIRCIMQQIGGFQLVITFFLVRLRQLILMRSLKLF